MYDRTFTLKQFIAELQRLSNPSLDNEDMYFSINQFMRKRQSDMLWRVNAIVLDFDYYKIEKYKHLSPLQFYEEILKNVLEEEPSYVLSSGQGLYVIYNLNIKYARGIEKYYQAIYRHLQLKYQDYGADASATLLTQVIRIPYSTNSKNNEDVVFLEAKKKKYLLKDFDKYLPYSIDEVKKYRSEKVKISNNNVIKPSITINYSLIKPIINDFKRLIRMRNESGYYEGYRELMIYIVRDFLKFTDISSGGMHKIIHQLNHLFYLPLTDDELIRVTTPSDTAKPHSKQRIIEKLGITEEEQKQLQYIQSHNVYTAMKKLKARLQQKQIAILTKKEKQYVRRKQIYQLMCEKPKLTKKEIAVILNVSERQVYRDIDYIQSHIALFIENKIELKNDSEEVLVIQKTPLFSCDKKGKDDP